MEDGLYGKLKKYCESDAYPFHMPGHKRRLMPKWGNPYAVDITEIDGFDNLHHAEGVLKEAQRKAAKLYGSEETHYLVNGSSGGILAAVSACTTMNGKLLMARNCHKAVWHCAQLRGLRTSYLYPRTVRSSEGIASLNGSIDPQDVEIMLQKEPDIEAVLITSPTYDGVVSDVASIAEIAHKYGIPLIVDEAHGAHFGFHPYFPESSVKLGADIVIHSLHKTLPSPTQTALLHVNGPLADREKLREYLGVYQTSSPSYLFMAGMDWCVNLLAREGGRLFDEFAVRLQRFYEEAAGLINVHVMRAEKGENIFERDPSKIIITAKGRNGLWIDNMLRDRFHLEMEMAAGDYALALTSIADTEEGFERLLGALRELDRENEIWREARECEKTGLPQRVEAKQIFTIAEAKERTGKNVLLRDSAGEISKEYCYLYPPGIPLLVPGEEISEAMLRQILIYQERGMSLHGIRDYAAKNIVVCR